jgi:hypothetical protein
MRTLCDADPLKVTLHTSPTKPSEKHGKGFDLYDCISTCYHASWECAMCMPRCMLIATSLPGFYTRIDIALTMLNDEKNMAGFNKQSCPWDFMFDDSNFSQASRQDRLGKAVVYFHHHRL